MTHSPLQALRIERERLSGGVEGVLVALMPDAPLQKRIAARQRLIESGITLPQVRRLHDAIDNRTESETACTAAMVRIGVPVEPLVEYLSAPSHTVPGTEGQAVKETIFNRVKKGATLKHTAVETFTHAAYDGAFLAAATSGTFLASRLGGAFESTAFYVQKVNDLFDYAGRVLPAVLDSAGLDAMSTLVTMGPVGNVMALSLAVGASSWQWNRARNTTADLAQTIMDPAAGVAGELFGPEKTQQVMAQYQRLNESDKHLMSHLSPYELRVVLTGGKDAAKEMFDARPIPFSQQVQACAHASHNRVEFMGQMIGLCFPEALKSGIRNAMEAHGMNPAEAGAPSAVLDKLYGRRAVAIEDSNAAVTVHRRPGWTGAPA